MLKTSFVSAEGLITLPEAMMNQVGIEHGSNIELEVRDGAIVIRKQLPISAYMGFSKAMTSVILSLLKSRIKTGRKAIFHLARHNNMASP